jgi:hypothetical protein
MSDLPKKPSWVWWPVVPLVWIAGIAGAVLLGYSMVSGAGESVVCMTVPGRQEFWFDHPGTYTVYHEYVSTFEGHTYHQQPGALGLALRITRKEDGAEVPTEPPHGTAAHSLGSNQGQAMMTFDVTQPGTYVIRAEADEPGVISIDKGFLLGSVFAAVGGVCAGVALAGAAFLVGLVILIVQIVRVVRYGKAKRALAAGG